MTRQIVVVAYRQQRVHETAVADTHLRRFDQTFAEVSMEGLKAAHEQEVRQEIDVAPDGRSADAERRGEPGGVQQRTLAVREHGPEPTQRLGRNSRPELRHVPLEIGADEIPSARETLRVVAGQLAVGKAAANPQPVLIAPAVDDLQHIEGTHLDISDAAGEALARLSQKIHRGRTEHQKASRSPPFAPTFVDQSAKRLEQLGRAMDLVENDQPAGVGAEEQGCIGQLAPVGRGFEVEVDRGPTCADRERKRRLAYLSRSNQPHRGLPSEGLLGKHQRATRYHPRKTNTPCSNRQANRSTI